MISLRKPWLTCFAVSSVSRSACDPSLTVTSFEPGKVKVNTHCYEATDIAAMIRHTNEFKFPLAALHHAHEAYLVPDLLKTAWNHTPAVALFATQARYKREAWRGSDYAPRILAAENITVIMKSDHPVLDSRFLMFEAQQARNVAAV